MIKYFCDVCKREITEGLMFVSVTANVQACTPCMADLFRIKAREHGIPRIDETKQAPAAPKPKKGAKPKAAPAGSKYDFEKAYAMWEAGKSGRRKPYTQKEIAAEIGCSHQRIAQLIKKWEQEYEG